MQEDVFWIEECCGNVSKINGEMYGANERLLNFFSG
jgi:hypothetical protein